MRIGVYGGTFFPPHVGHGMVAAWARWAGRVDEVWLVPVHQHPFAKALAPFEHRVAWCEALAEAVGPWVRVSRVEQELEGTSYTIRTLRTLRARHPEHVFRLILGADLLPSTPRWRDWDGIAAEFSPLVVGRQGHPEVADAPTFPDVSSTAIRDALRRDDDVSAWVPAGVRAAMARTGVTLPPHPGAEG